MIVPFAGSVATAMPLENPDICAVTSMATGVLNAAVAITLATVGAGAEVTVILTVATPDVPPGPVAR